MNNLALSAGKKRIHAQTGFLHYCAHALPEEDSVTVPLMENVLYALALLQTRTVENITEGKRLLERMMAFQDKSSGHFPVYLHDYPECTDCYQGIHLLIPFYWILKQFQQVLGSDLKKGLDLAVEKNLVYGLDEMKKRTIPATIGIKIASAAISFGRLYQRKEWEAQGKSFLICYEEPSSIWFEPRSLGEMMISLQMIDTDFSCLPGFWEHLCHTFHQSSATYAGPSLRELQFKEEPQVTLYDLFWASLTTFVPERVLRDHPCHLYGSVIQPCSAFQKEQSYPANFEGALSERAWQMILQKTFALSFIEQKEVHDPAKDKGFSPLHLVWGSPKRLHTFVCQGGNSKLKDFFQTGKDFTFLAELGEPVSLEDRDKSRELAFFFDIPSHVKVTVNSISVNTFRAGDEVFVATDGLTFRLSFIIEEGEGQFMGHFMRGNRPSQLANKGIHRFDAYDWQLFIRTIRRTDSCTLRVTLSV